ncbi:MAG: phosphoribosyltransferase family protein [Paludibacter sp.]|nr:phosphoribosyltransferase family protein [Paludibacter sp.]
MYYRNVADMNRIIIKRLCILPRDFDLIVGIPRSGMLPANLLALYLSKPFTDIDSFRNGHIYKAGERGQFIDVKKFKKILVVDDSIASGSAMNKAKEQIKEVGEDFEISFCAVYVIPGKEKMVDYYFEVVPLPRYFQWNILNHTILEKSCFDIDGVLCVDPTEEQNDDGPKYIDFILNAAPLYIPTSQIGTLVTSRLEKYRKETETWLKKNNVKYKKLVMLDLPDKEARQKANNHASHKSTTYKSSEYALFFESSLNQAIEINHITKKPVFCTETFEMIYNDQSVIYNLKSGKYFPGLKNLALKLRNKLRNR